LVRQRFVPFGASSAKPVSLFGYEVGFAVMLILVPSGGYGTEESEVWVPSVAGRELWALVFTVDLPVVREPGRAFELGIKAGECLRMTFRVVAGWVLGT